MLGTATHPLALQPRLAVHAPAAVHRLPLHLPLPRPAASVVNNMPHGGTLVVVPPTLVGQWEDEIRKTTDAPLSILRWTEHSKRQERLLDCKVIAEYDVVLVSKRGACMLSGTGLHDLPAVKVSAASSFLLYDVVLVSTSCMLHWLHVYCEA